VPIDAKRIDAKGGITTVPLSSEDPADIDLVNALGGKGHLMTLGQIGPWEVLSTSDRKDETLVIGRPPYISDHPKRRSSCTLDDKKVTRIAALVREGWGLLG
jgi:hypothetical protein